MNRPLHKKCIEQAMSNLIYGKPNREHAQICNECVCWISRTVYFDFLLDTEKGQGKALPADATISTVAHNTNMNSKNKGHYGSPNAN